MAQDTTLRQVVPELVEGLRDRKLNHRNINLLDSPVGSDFVSRETVPQINQAFQNQILNQSDIMFFAQK